MKRLGVFLLWACILWPCISYTYPTTFALEEEMRDGGTIWGWLFLFLGFYLVGLFIIFAYCLVKFQSHITAPGYYSTCMHIAKSKAKLFSTYEFFLYILGIPILLIPSGIVIAVINVVFFEFLSETLLITWLFGVLVIDLLGSIFFALRESLIEINPDCFYSSTEEINKIKTSDRLLIL